MTSDDLVHEALHHLHRAVELGEWSDEGSATEVLRALGILAALDKR